MSVVSDSVRPQRRQPTRFPRPWDSPGKNTGVGCPFLLQCMKVKSESEVAQSCLTLRDPMGCSLLGSSIHGIFQARVLEWGAIAFYLMLKKRMGPQWLVASVMRAWKNQGLDVRAFPGPAAGQESSELCHRCHSLESPGFRGKWGSQQILWWAWSRHQDERAAECSP